MELLKMWRQQRLFVVHLLLFLGMCGCRSGRLSAMARRYRNKGNQWWNLAHTPQLMSSDPLSTESNLFITPPVHPLTRKQLKLVTKNPGSTMAVARGAKLAVDECQHQFRFRRWNCPVSEYNHGGSIFGKILKKGCRETAFVYAITSAALSHTVARSCSSGTIYTCSCGMQLDPAHHRPDSAHSPASWQRGGGTGGGAQRPSDWQWGGCSDNIEFGYRFSRDFIDTNEKERDLRCAMNLHNNEAGRTHVSAEMRQECKCHGMSGNCAIKTCWRRLPTFRQVGDLLSRHFDSAAKVDQGNDIRERSRLALIPAESGQPAPSSGDLVYYENSPSFCEADPSVGHKGVRGRQCNATSSGEDGCHRMCCGRGYQSESRPVRERCNCVFHWCCWVTCDTCTILKARHTCL